MFFLLIASTFLIPVILIVCGGLIARGHYPKHPNNLCGYRTPRSMRNDEAWDFAQKRWGRLSWWFGWALLGVSAIFAALLKTMSVQEKTAEIYSFACLMIQPLLTLATIPPVELALKRRFGDKASSPRQ